PRPWLQSAPGTDSFLGCALARGISNSYVSSSACPHLAHSTRILTTTGMSPSMPASMPSVERLIYSSRIGIDLWRRLCGGTSNDDEEHPVMRNSDDGHERSSQRLIDYVRLQGRRYLGRFVRGHRLWQFHVR